MALEFAYYRNDFPVFDSLYLGGGTPSLLEASQLGRLLEFLQREAAFAPDSEVTLEANPDDLTPAKLLAYRQLGINRLSLGVQSFNDAELCFLGRRHTAAQAQEALKMARDAGFANLSLDLMYGLPGQTRTGWEKSLAAALAFRPEHLSCYQLTVEPGTELARRRGDGLKSLVGEDEEREFFLFTSDFLTRQGYLHYEISNFAHGKEHACRHNLKYWRRLPYLGLGPAAHSFDGRRRWWNFRSLNKYLEALSRGTLPAAGEETLTAEQVRLESMLLGFRTREGVAMSLIQGLPGGENTLGIMQAEGWVKVRKERVKPTREGLLLADRLPLLLID